MRVAVIGATGQLGRALVRALEESGTYQVVALGHAEIECTDPTSVDAVLGAARPDVVVNCAAIVRVDECEDHPDEAFRTNTLGALNVARVTDRLGALCVLASTDYVFDGEKPGPYTEDDAPIPINIYGTSKLAGEHTVRQTCREWLIVRLSSLYGPGGARGKRGNFITTILAKAGAGERLRVVDDIRMSPTYAPDAAVAIQKLLELNVRGIMHVSNSGSCTWYEFARWATHLAGAPAVIDPVPTIEYPTKARRPANSALATERLRLVTGIQMRSWVDALGVYVAQQAMQ